MLDLKDLETRAKGRVPRAARRVWATRVLTTNLRSRKEASDRADLSDHRRLAFVNVLRRVRASRWTMERRERRSKVTIRTASGAEQSAELRLLGPHGAVFGQCSPAARCSAVGVTRRRPCWLSGGLFSVASPPVAGSNLRRQIHLRTSVRALKFPSPAGRRSVLEIIMPVASGPRSDLEAKHSNLSRRRGKSVHVARPCTQ